LNITCSRDILVAEKLFIGLGQQSLTHLIVSAVYKYRKPVENQEANQSVHVYKTSSNISEH